MEKVRPAGDQGTGDQRRGVTVVKNHVERRIRPAAVGIALQTIHVPGEDGLEIPVGRMAGDQDGLVRRFLVNSRDLFLFNDEEDGPGQDDEEESEPKKQPPLKSEAKFHLGFLIG